MNETVQHWNRGAVMPLTEEEMSEEKKRTKASFDTEDDVADIIEQISEKGFAKGAFLNACVRIAWEAALDDLIDALKSLKKSPRPGGDQKSNKGNKP